MSYPQPRTLLKVWIVLMALTIGTMIAGKVTSEVSVGLLWMAVLLSVTWLKATLILRYYLDLKSATGGWGKVFGALVAFIIGAVFVLYLSPFAGIS